MKYFSKFKHIPVKAPQYNTSLTLEIKNKEYY